MLSLFDEWPHDCEAQFWAAYPRKVAKLEAMRVLAKIRAKGGVRFTDLLAAVERYKVWLSEANPPRVWRPEPKHASTWLNSGGWNDEWPSPKLNLIRKFDDAKLRAQFEERARFEAEQAARKHRPTYAELRAKYDGPNGEPWGIQQLDATAGEGEY
jgi:hypothetical protein